MDFRVGHGYDVHRLAEKRALILGGVCIPYEKGLDGHSDADVLIHAIMDALFGAAGMGDIGMHFPDSDIYYKGMSSLRMLENVRTHLKENSWAIQNIDSTIIAQAPKLGQYRKEMAQNIASALDIPADAVNIKATTEEGLGFTGTKQGMAAHAVCLLWRSMG